MKLNSNCSLLPLCISDKNLYSFSPHIPIRYLKTVISSSKFFFSSRGRITLGVFSQNTLCCTMTIFIILYWTYPNKSMSFLYQGGEDLMQ